MRYLFGAVALCRDKTVSGLRIFLIFYLGIKWAQNSTLSLEVFLRKGFYKKIHNLLIDDQTLTGKLQQ